MTFLIRSNLAHVASALRNRGVCHTLPADQTPCAFGSGKLGTPCLRTQAANATSLAVDTPIILV
jgi:hypothetical protein